jgi:hypothetical protein
MLRSEQLTSAVDLTSGEGHEQLLPAQRPPYLFLLYLTKVLSQLLIAALLSVSDVLVTSLGALQRMV